MDRARRGQAAAGELLRWRGLALHTIARLSETWDQEIQPDAEGMDACARADLIAHRFPAELAAVHRLERAMGEADRIADALP